MARQQWKPTLLQLHVCYNDKGIKLDYMRACRVMSLFCSQKKKNNKTCVFILYI